MTFNLQSKYCIILHVCQNNSLNECTVHLSHIDREFIIDEKDVERNIFFFIK